MARALTLSLIPMLLLSGSTAATPVGPGDVSGSWIVAGSPYVVAGHITVPTGQTLTIDPGVEVRFDGNYVLTVEGVISAIGTAVDSIYFKPHVPGTTWGHVDMPQSADGGSIFEFCRVERSNSLGNLPPHSTHGGGIFCATNLTTIANCSIEWCVGEDGGGLYLRGNVSAQDCVIRHCEAGGNGTQEEGGGVYLEGVASLIRCTVSDNVANFGGGGIVATIFLGEISDCIVMPPSVEGHGGGISLGNFNASAVVRGNLVAGNDCGTQGYSDGGGVYFWYAYGGTFEENTIVHNTAPQGAGIAYGNATQTVSHCVIAFNNGAASYDIAGPSTVSFVENCVWGNTLGDQLIGTESGTIYLDPLFCDASGSDYRLCADSPCLPLGIGAYGEGCAACQSAIAISSWSRIKSLY